MTVREFQMGRFRRLLLTRIGCSIPLPERGSTYYEDLMDDRYHEIFADDKIVMPENAQ